MDKKKIGILLLRLGLAFVFIYAGVGTLIAPDSWVGYFPSFLKKMVGESLLLKAHGTLDILIGLWLLSGVQLFYSSLASALLLAGIVIFNFGVMDVVFRDIGLALASLALTFLSLKSE